MARDSTPAAGIGHRIREARKARGWSQSDLAFEAAVSRPTIARIEGGQHVLMGTLEKVAKTLEFDVALLRLEPRRIASSD